jgi:hypothetical protein
MRKCKAIVKYFPEGYIIHKEGSLERFTTNCERWHVVEHHGTAPDGIEIYEIVGGAYPHQSKQMAIRQLQHLRSYGFVE